MQKNIIVFLCSSWFCSKKNVAEAEDLAGLMLKVMLGAFFFLKIEDLC